MSHTHALAAFLAPLSLADLPEPVLARTEDKFRRLLSFADALDGDQAGVLIERVWGLRDASDLKGLMEIKNEK